MPISLRDVISKQFLGCIFSVSSTCLATCLAHKHSYNPSPPKRAHTHTHTHRISSFSVQPSLSSAALENDFIGMTSVPLPPYFCHPGPQPASKCSMQHHRSSSFFASPLLLSLSARSDFSSDKSNISFQSQQRQGLLSFFSLPLTIPLHPPLSTKQKMGAGAVAGYYLFEISILIIDQ